MNSILLQKRKVGIDAPPFIIAEMSGNHNQSLNRAMKIVEAAAKAGAHALKLQTYTADTMTLNLSRSDFVISGDRHWKDQSLYQLYQKACTPWNGTNLFLRGAGSSECWHSALLLMKQQ